MDLANGNEREAISKLVEGLLSRDPTKINATINASFTPDAVYRGHGLDIRGVSNLKHASWFWNTALDSGKAATFGSKDIEWDEQKQIASIQTRRYFRLRAFPLVGFTLNVPVRLHLKTSNGTAYVSRYEEEWLAERVLAGVPLAQAVHESLSKNVMTLMVLTLSNAAFSTFAHVQTLEPVARAKKSLPADVARGIDKGFAEGSQLAQGWGTKAVDVVSKVAYPPLRVVETGLQWSTQLAQNVLSIDLPYPFIYDVHSTPNAGRITSSEGKSTTSTSKEEKPSATSKQDDLPSNDKESHEESVHAHQESSQSDKDQDKDASTAKKVEDDGISVFDQMVKDGQDPVAQAAEDEAKALEAAAAHEAQKNADDDGSASGAAKLPKRKSNKKKKAANGNGSINGNGDGHGETIHAPPPTFKEGLEHAETNEA